MSRASRTVVGAVSEHPIPMRLSRVHPLDSPVVTVAVESRTSGGGKGAVRAVKAHAGRVVDTFTHDPAADGNLFPAFVGEFPIVGHDLGRTADLLGGAGVLSSGEWWDLGELAGLLLPRGEEASLSELAAMVGVEASPASSAVDVTRLVYEELVRRGRQRPASVLHRQADLLARAHSPLSVLLAALADASTSLDAGPIDGVDQREIAQRLERPRPVGSPKPPQPLDPAEITRLLSDGGALAARFPRYEPREEQIAMACAVADALGSRADDGEPHHLVVEGGTGIGKSVAYLLPAMLFAIRNNARVVVSTNTINLQEQLVAKDIPDVAEALRGVPGLDVANFRYAQLKGKANYLCLRRWQAVANSDLMGPDDAKMLAKTLPWLRETRTGDRAELALKGRDLTMWDRLSATSFSMCPGAREGACFYRHARDTANAAHLLVVNHALLLSNMQVGGTVLPDFDYLIVDEAHNLEDEATRQFGFRVLQSTVEDLVERLGNIVQSLGNAVRAGRLEEPRKQTMASRLEEAQLPLYRVRDTWAELSAHLAAFAASQRSQDAGDDGELRITPGLRAQPAWSEIEIACDAFQRAAEESEERAAALLREAEDLSPDEVPGLDEMRGSLAEWLGDEAEARDDIAGFVSSPDEQMVYWLGRAAGPLSLSGAPLDVGPRLNAELFGEKRSVVLTSATMTVGGGFAHVRGRLGLDEAEELWLGSPFDYRKAVLLCLPTDVPEPGARRYPEAVAGVIAGLASGAGGRTLALFTSHAAIRGAAAALRRALAARGIAVLAQGVDGTPQQLLARFQTDPKAVLLGTSSFWEGVDIADNAMKVLVVARLPFNVPTEPVFAARSALYDRPFMEYAVPQAVLRFRQGFGRLIRSKSDHGVVVVLDSRITSKPYGATFLNSLPPASVLRAPLAEVAGGVQRWLAGASGG